MKLFFHLALDEFGAEVLGRFHQVLPDLEDRGAERHINVWAGCAAAPGDSDYWSTTYPVWDGEPWEDARFPVPYDPGVHGEVGTDLDRKGLASATARQFTEGILQAGFPRMLAYWENKLAGAGEAAGTTLILHCSLANPGGSALLLGILAGLDALRRIGAFSSNVYAVLGLGCASGVSTGLPPHMVEALAARGLEDLQQYFKQRGVAGGGPTACFLVGEKSIGERQSDRTAQVAIAAHCTLGITRSVLSNHPDADYQTNPFCIDDRIGEGVYVAGRLFDPENPFSVVGSRSVHVPAIRPAGLLASRACGEFISAYLAQDVCPDIEKCAKIELTPELRNFIAFREETAIREFWGCVSKRETIPWDSREAAGGIL